MYYERPTTVIDRHCKSNIRLVEETTDDVHHGIFRLDSPTFVDDVSQGFRRISFDGGDRSQTQCGRGILNVPYTRYLLCTGCVIAFIVVFTVGRRQSAKKFACLNNALRRDIAEQ